MTTVASFNGTMNEWRSNPLVPKWVDLDTVELDRFFTRPEIAEQCHSSLIRSMAEDYAPVDDYHFIDPEAGKGAFFDLLDPNRRTAIELVPTRLDFIQADYLGWKPQAHRRHAVIGSPPFGVRAWLALAFVNHSAVFADYIGFILPMAFQSDGKGSPKHRVVGAELVHSQELPPDAFTDEAGQPLKVNALWQIWRRGVNNRRPAATCDNWIDLFAVDVRKERLCGQTRLQEADWFLQRTFYNTPPRLVRDFEEVRYRDGYGIVVKRRKREVADRLNSTDWHRYSNLAAHNCRHISMHHIRSALVDAGYTDGRRNGGRWPDVH